MYDEAVWLLGIAVKYGDPLHGSLGRFPHSRVGKDT